MRTAAQTPLTHPSTSDSPQSGRPLLRAAAMVTLATLAGAAVIHLAVRLPGVPYNVRELFPRAHPGASMAALALLGMWTGLAPGWIAAWLVRRPARILGTVLWVLLAALVGWVLLDFAVTPESLYDALGSPVLGWPRDWELVVRFLALYGGILGLLTVAAAALRAPVARGLGRGLALGLLALLAAAPGLALARQTVIPWAATDNLTELIRSRPYPGEAALGLLVLLIGAHAAALAEAALARRRRWAWLPAALLGFVAAIPAGWALLQAGLEPSVTKYGQTFPAVRFLLGPDRTTMLSTQDLLLRWVALQAGLTLVLAWGMAAGGPAGRAPRASVPDARLPRRVTAVLLAAYVAFLVYGHLVPLRLRSLSVSEAWGRYWPRLLHGDTGPADRLANVLVYVPLAVLAMAVLLPAPARARGLRKALAAVSTVAGGLTLSFTLEFLQLWAYRRTVSVDDLVSQTLGGLVGVGLWLALGPRLSAGAARLLGSAEDARRQRGTLLLAIYAAVAALYLLLPLTLSLSATSLWHRLKDPERTVLVPLAELPTRGPHLLAPLAMLVPVGWLADLLARTSFGRRPRRAWLWAAAGLAGLLCARLLVRSVTVSTSDLLFGLVGLATGVWLAGRLDPPGGARPRPLPRGLAPAALALWLAVLVWLKWHPFDFAAPPGGMGTALDRMVDALLIRQFEHATPMHALAQVLQEFGLFLALGLLARATVPRHPARPAMLGATIVVAMILEAAQTLLPSRQADSTTVLVNVAGVAMGWLLAEPLARALLPGRRLSASSPGPQVPRA